MNTSLNTAFSQVDPYSILKVAKNFTLEELKECYRDASRKVHPDRQNGSEEKFKLVTHCFKKLAAEFKAREMDKPHDAMRNEYKTFHDAQNNAQMRNVALEKLASTTMQSSSKPSKTANEDFLRKFNRVFEDTRLEDPYQAGYGAQMAASSKAREDLSAPPIYEGKYNHSAFNRTFELNVKSSEVDERQIDMYREPQPMNDTKVGFYELGGAAPDNFSGDNQGRDLHFSDYMQAHTTSRLIPNETATRREYKSMEDLQSARQNMGNFSDQEMMGYKNHMARREEQELDRQRKLKEYDSKLESNFNRANQMLLDRR